MNLISLLQQLFFVGVSCVNLLAQCLFSALQMCFIAPDGTDFFLQDGNFTLQFSAQDGRICQLCPRLLHLSFQRLDLRCNPVIFFLNALISGRRIFEISVRNPVFFFRIGKLCPRFFTFQQKYVNVQRFQRFPVF